MNSVTSPNSSRLITVPAALAMTISLAAFLGYGAAKRASKNPERFGTMPPHRTFVRYSGFRWSEVKSPPSS